MEEVLVIVEIVAVRDAAALESYRVQARVQGAARGCTLVARHGHGIEGDPPFGEVMVQRWPSEQAFRDWQESEDYKPLLAVRRAAAELRIAIVPVV